MDSAVVDVEFVIQDYGGFMDCFEMALSLGNKSTTASENAMPKFGKTRLYLFLICFADYLILIICPFNRIRVC
jgi:hypothetical protein